MLRDKFIHYFQQWRERQLSRGEHWLAQHLAGRSPREKGMLLAAVVFLFSVGYYVLIWQPLSERIEQQETMLQQLVRSEEHTSELQSRFDLVCRLLLEKKKYKI